MTPRVLDATTVVALLGEIAAERPDYVYQRGEDGCCRYVDGVGDDARPGCIIGHLYHRVGVDLDYLASCEWVTPHHVAYGLDDITLTRTAGEVLFLAQYRQDRRRTWGEVAAAAAAELPTHTSGRWNL
jgi:hypothetical protein